MSNYIRKAIRLLMPPGIIKLLIEYFWTPNDLRKKYPKSQIGSPLHLNPSFLELEECTRIQDEVMIISCDGKVKIKKYSAIGARSCFIPGTHIPTVGLPQWFSRLHINDVASIIEIGEDCWIGADTLMLNKAKVGRGAVIGSRSLVTKPIPPYAVVAGSPAKIIAVRFSKEQILKHESILYDEKERFSEMEIDELFANFYSGLRVIGTSEISEEDAIILSEARKSIGLPR